MRVTTTIQTAAITIIVDIILTHHGMAVAIPRNLQCEAVKGIGDETPRLGAREERTRGSAAKKGLRQVTRVNCNDSYIVRKQRGLLQVAAGG